MKAFLSGLSSMQLTAMHRLSILDDSMQTLDLIDA